MKQKFLGAIIVGCFLTLFGLCGTMDAQDDLPLYPFIIYYMVTLLIIWLAIEAMEKRKVKVIYVDRVPAAVPIERWKGWRDINCYANAKRSKTK